MSQEEKLSEQLLDFIGEHEDISLYKDTALTLANILIDLSKEKYGRWEIDIFIASAIADIIEQTKELRKELREL